MQQLNHYINGKFVAPQAGAYLDVFEPATGSVYAQVAAGDKDDVEAAVGAAQDAFPAWKKMPATERAAILFRLADLIEKNLERLAKAESIDNGKPVALARELDIPRAAANLRFFGAAVLHLRSESYRTDSVALNYVLRQPCGVAGIISPWNLPLYLLSWKVAPALAVGNTVVAKPSEITPMTAFMFCELCQEAGLPPGVLNVVHGRGAEAGAAIVRHPNVPVISFTGGTATGADIAGAAGPMFKKVGLELGGKNPNIVFADADQDEAGRESLRSSFANQGQVCLCGSRIYVERSVYQPFLENLVAGAKALKIGDPLDESTEQGALASRAQFDKISSYVDLARELGGTIHCGGQEPGRVSERCAGGYFFEPTVMTDLPADCRVNQEEIFGPVVTVTPFDTEDEAVAYANGTAYGLAASVWTRDLARAHRVAERVDAGTVWINCWMVRDLRAPFGGMKQSGVGREGGEEALRFFTEPKNVCIRV